MNVYVNLEDLRALVTAAMTGGNKPAPADSMIRLCAAIERGDRPERAGLRGWHMLPTIWSYPEANKIGAIKAVRAATAAGLREAKDFVETGTPIRFPPGDYDRDELARQIRECGGKVGRR